MADKLHFSLVSPEREMFAGDVDQVDAPGSEGMFGVLPMHAPFMTTLKSGEVTIFNDGEKTRLFVRGGFADVTPQGLTILAEHAVDLAALDASIIAGDLKDAREDLESAKDPDAHELARLEDEVRYLEALSGALNA